MFQTRLKVEVYRDQYLDEDFVHIDVYVEKGKIKAVIEGEKLDDLPPRVREAINALLAHFQPREPLPLGLEEAEDKEEEI